MTVSLPEPPTGSGASGAGLASCANAGSPEPAITRPAPAAAEPRRISRRLNLFLSILFSSKNELALRGCGPPTVLTRNWSWESRERLLQAVGCGRTRGQRSMREQDG